MSQALYQNQRLYGVMESAFGTVPSITGANACRLTTADFNQAVGIIERNDQTGTRSPFQIIKGRRKGSWSVAMDLTCSGTAGTKPDADFLFQLAFGVAGTNVAATSHTYNLADTIKSASLFHYLNNPTTLNQKISLGSVLSTMKIAFGGPVPLLTASGDALWCLDSDFYSTASTTEKGGLGSFPAEPGSQTYNGIPAAGFTGSITIGGNVITEIQEGDITIGPGNQTIDDTFGSYWPTGTIGARRKVDFNFKCFDSDTTGVKALRNAAQTQNSVAATLVLGTVAGSICTITMPTVILAIPGRAESNLRFGLTFNGNRATASTPSALDEITIAFT